MTHIAVLRACWALAVVLGTATIASAGSRGFGAATVRIGPNGLEPSSLRIAAYHHFTVWQNDSVAHTLEFEDGRCIITLAAGACGYTRQPLMAVPKKKTSKARRDKRRAQHGIEAPRVNVCPTCHQPKRPHRVCPTCKTYKGREIEPLRTPVP